MRLFVAVWPPADVVEALARLPRPSAADVRWTRRELWHVTLRFLGDVPTADGVVDELRAASLPAATARLGPAVQRFTPEVAAVPVAGLDALAAAVDEALGGPDGRFRGHLTVARARRRGRIPVAITGAPIAATWTVDEVAVVRSHLSSSGPTYETLETVAATRR